MSGKKKNRMASSQITGAAENHFIAYIKRHQNCISVMLGVFGACSVQSVLKIESESIIYSNSFIVIAVMIGFFFLVKNAVLLINKRLLAVSAVVGFLFSMFLICGTALFQYESIAERWVSQCFSILGLWGIMASIITILLGALNGHLNVEGLRFPVRMERALASSVRLYLLLWFLIMLCWIPTFLAFYPGIYAYDAPWQLRMILDTSYMSSHHPLIHTFFFSSFMCLGKYISSFELGLAMHSVAQMLLLSAAASYSCTYMRRIKAPLWIVLLSALWFGLLPVHAIMSISPTKDTLFSASVLLFITLVIEMFYCPGRLKSRFFGIRFVVTACLMLFFRNNGLHAFLFFTIFFVIIMKKNRKRVAALSMIPVVIYLAGNAALSNSLQAEKGRFSEALSVPVQQLARVVNERGEEMSPQELADIFSYISEDAIYGYDPYLSDWIKANLDEEKFIDDPVAFVCLWLHTGIRYPVEYIDSFLLNTLPYWYPDMEYPLSQDYLEVAIKERVVDITRSSVLPGLLEVETEIGLRAAHQRIPLVSMLFSPGFYTWILLFSVAGFVYCKKYTMLMPCSLLIGLEITMLLGPIALVRYSYPIIMCAPVILWTLVVALRSPLERV